jgi:hypothetical protein
MGELVAAVDLEVALDYHQLYLRGWSDFDIGEGVLDVSTEAITSPDGVAGDGWVLVVITPRSFDVHMRVRVEQWTAEPPDDVADWQDAVEGPLFIEGGVLHLDSPTMEGTSTPVPDGMYAVRVCGRDLHPGDADSTTAPGDVWRVQLWPAVPIRRLRRLTG